MRASACMIAGALIAGLGSSLAGAAESSYTPTMKDWMSIQEALHNYHSGLDLHDNKIMARAFTADGELVARNESGKEYRLKGRDRIALLGIMGTAPPPSGPPPPPGDRWHFTADDHFEFVSATRATHTSYWLDMLVTTAGGVATLSTPGHYEDVLVKQPDGQWLFTERKIVVGRK